MLLGQMSPRQSTSVKVGPRKLTYQIEKLVKKKISDSMFSLESDEMAAVWPNDSITYFFSLDILKKHTNSTTFI